MFGESMNVFAEVTLGGKKYIAHGSARMGRRDAEVECLEILDAETEEPIQNGLALIATADDSWYVGDQILDAAERALKETPCKCGDRCHC